MCNEEIFACVRVKEMPLCYFFEKNIKKYGGCHRPHFFSVLSPFQAARAGVTIPDLHSSWIRTLVAVGCHISNQKNLNLYTVENS